MAKKPKAVRQQEEEAARLHQQLYGSGESETGDEPPAGGKEGETGKQAGEGDPPPTGEGDSSPAPETGQAAGDEGQPKPGEGEETGEQDWKAKYEQAMEELERERARNRTLQGKYNSEVPRLSNELKAVRAELQELKAGQGGEGQTRKPAEGKLDTSELDAELETLRADYGDDFVNSMKSMAEHFAKRMIAPLQEEVGAVRQETAQTAQERFEAKLDAAVPDWRKINEDPRFVEWLQHYDPMLGMTRHERINQAGKQHNAEAVISFFRAFQEAAGVPRGTPKPKAEATPEPSQTPSRRDPNEYAQPGGGRTPSPVEGPRYSMEDWVALQDERRRGKWRGRDDEFRAKEREIHQALFGRAGG